MDQIKTNREFMKANYQALEGIKTDQELNLPQPPLQKPYDEAASTVISLPKASSTTLLETNIHTCLKKRRSIRKYSEDALSIEELSFLLWATQGVQRVFGNNYSTFRPVPSGGARHPFETYLLINRITGLQRGVYRYLPLTHQLLLLFFQDDFTNESNEIFRSQTFIGESAVTFIWSCIPYRSEWRYNIAAHKAILIDAGHLCQNLYLACVAVGCGACAIGDYDQALLDRFLNLDGTDEFVVYLAPVGKV
jgi:SagB-type dehydrogenase family enzyme